MARKRPFTDTIVIHCSATSPSMDIGVREIDRWHRARGFLSIGYHFVIRRDGKIELGRNADEIGAHARGHNETSIGICMIGGVEEQNPQQPQDNFTPDQWKTLESLVRDLRVMHTTEQTGVPAIVGHGELPGVRKACPSFDVKAWASTRFN